MGRIISYGLEPLCKDCGVEKRFHSAKHKFNPEPITEEDLKNWQRDLARAAPISKVQVSVKTETTVDEYDLPLLPTQEYELGIFETDMLSGDTDYDCLMTLGESIKFSDGKYFASSGRHSGYGSQSPFSPRPGSEEMRERFLSGGIRDLTGHWVDMPILMYRDSYQTITKIVKKVKTKKPRVFQPNNNWHHQASLWRSHLIANHNHNLKRLRKRLNQNG